VVLLPTTPLSITFLEVIEAFLTYYATHQKTKRSSHHLLSVKMRPGDSLKSYINFFQSQLTKVSNYDEEVSALALSAGYRSPTLYTSTSWSITSPRWARLFPERSHTSSKRRQWRHLPTTQQSLAITEQNWSLHTKLPTVLQINIGAASLKEAGALYTPAKSNPKLQAYIVLHSIKTSNQQSIQHIQR